MKYKQSTIALYAIIGSKLFDKILKKNVTIPIANLYLQNCHVNKQILTVMQEIGVIKFGEVFIEPVADFNSNDVRIALASHYSHAEMNRLAAKGKTKKNTTKVKNTVNTLVPEKSKMEDNSKDKLELAKMWEDQGEYKRAIKLLKEIASK